MLVCSAEKPNLHLQAQSLEFGNLRHFRRFFFKNFHRLIRLINRVSIDYSGRKTSLESTFGTRKIFSTEFYLVQKIF